MSQANGSKSKSASYRKRPPVTMDDVLRRLRIRSPQRPMYFSSDEQDDFDLLKNGSKCRPVSVKPRRFLRKTYNWDSSDDETVLPPLRRTTATTYNKQTPRDTEKLQEITNTVTVTKPNRTKKKAAFGSLQKVAESIVINSSDECQVVATSSSNVRSFSSAANVAQPTNNVASSELPQDGPIQCSFDAGQDDTNVQSPGKQNDLSHMNSEADMQPSDDSLFDNPNSCFVPTSSVDEPSFSQPCLSPPTQSCSYASIIPTTDRRRALQETTKKQFSMNIVQENSIQEVLPMCDGVEDIENSDISQVASLVENPTLSTKEIHTKSIKELTLDEHAISTINDQAELHLDVSLNMDSFCDPKNSSLIHSSSIVLFSNELSIPQTSFASVTTGRTYSSISSKSLRRRALIPQQENTSLHILHRENGTISTTTDSSADEDEPILIDNGLNNEVEGPCISRQIQNISIISFNQPDTFEIIENRSKLNINQSDLFDQTPLETTPLDALSLSQCYMSPIVQIRPFSSIRSQSSTTKSSRRRALIPQQQNTSLPHVQEECNQPTSNAANDDDQMCVANAVYAGPLDFRDTSSACHASVNHSNCSVPDDIVNKMPNSLDQSSVRSESSIEPLSDSSRDESVQQNSISFQEESATSIDLNPSIHDDTSIKNYSKDNSMNHTNASFPDENEDVISTELWNAQALISTPMKEIPGRRTLANDHNSVTHQTSSSNSFIECSQDGLVDIPNHEPPTSVSALSDRNPSRNSNLNHSHQSLQSVRSGTSQLNSSSSSCNNSSIAIPSSSVPHIAVSDDSVESPKYDSACVPATSQLNSSSTSSCHNTSAAIAVPSASAAHLDQSQTPSLILSESHSSSNASSIMELTAPRRITAGKWRRSVAKWKRENEFLSTGRHRSTMVTAAHILPRKSMFHLPMGNASFFESSPVDVKRPIRNLPSVRFADEHGIHFETLTISDDDEDERSAEQIVLDRCGQSEPLPFEEVYPESRLPQLRKIGEGVFGEVFMYRTSAKNSVVLKIIPIEGDLLVNGEQQKKFDEMLPEIIIADELSKLRNGRDFSTSGFVKLLRVRCVRGNYPEHLIDQWELYRDNRGTENDDPAEFGPDQLFIVLEQENAGIDLEAFKFRNASQSLAALQQIALTLAVAEQKLQFEHRDLHWGNILLAPTDHPELSFTLNGRSVTVPTEGIKATIIDYTLSRMVFNNQVLHNDLAKDDELFSAVGDYQFEIYRLMKAQLDNDWTRFNPFTNVLWLHYIVDKMISGARYTSTRARAHLQAIEKLKVIRDVFLDHKTAPEIALVVLAGF